ncbi:hypothetical protein IW262DRAFT_1464276 [Armillaria fumosa]|nr:hypothetical protein IW262DRAFT_1464276 [Armillaria fumosa]
MQGHHSIDAPAAAVCSAHTQIFHFKVGKPLSEYEGSVSVRKTRHLTETFCYAGKALTIQGRPLKEIIPGGPDVAPLVLFLLFACLYHSLHSALSRLSPTNTTSSFSTPQISAVATRPNPLVMLMKGISALDFETGFVPQATRTPNKLSACCAGPLHCKRWSDPQRLYPSQYRLLRDKAAENEHKWRRAISSAREAEERAKELEGRIDLCKEETAKAMDEEIRTKTRRIQLQEDEIVRKDEIIRLMDERIRRMGGELRRKDEEVRKRAQDIKATDEYRRKDGEARLLAQRCQHAEKNLTGLCTENTSLRQRICDHQEEKETILKELESVKGFVGAKDQELIETRAALSSKQAELVNNSNNSTRIIMTLRQKIFKTEREAQKKVLDVEEGVRREILATEEKMQELTKELAASREEETRARAGHESAVEQLISKLEEVRRVAAEREKEIERLAAALKDEMLQRQFISERCRDLEMRPPHMDESYQRRLEEVRSVAMAELNWRDEKISLMQKVGRQLVAENQRLSGEIEQLQGWKGGAWDALEERDAKLRQKDKEITAAREDIQELVGRNRMLTMEVEGLRSSTDMVMAPPSDGASLSQMTTLVLTRGEELNRVKEELARSLERERQALENFRTHREQAPQEKPRSTDSETKHLERYDRLVEVIDLINDRICRATRLSVPTTDLDLSLDIAFLNLQTRLDEFEDSKIFENIPWPVSVGVGVDPETMALRWETTEQLEQKEASFLEHFSKSLSLQDVDPKPTKPPTWEKELPLFLETFSESHCPQNVDVEIDYLTRIQAAFDMDQWAKAGFMQKPEEDYVRERVFLVKQEIDRVVDMALKKKLAAGEY